ERRLEELLHGPERPRQSRRRRSGPLRCARQCRARIGSHAPHPRRLEFRLAVLVLGSDQEGAHALTGVRRRQLQADRSDPYDKPVVAFPAHWAPLQLAMYTGTQFPEKYRGGAFVAFHGSWNRAPRPQAGYLVAFVPFDTQGMPTGAYEVFADGFAGRDEFVRTRDARFRACGIAVGPDGSLYITDTEKGRIWRVIYTGETSTARAGAASPAATA